MTDSEMILKVLSDMKPHHVQEIYDRCRPGARNWAVRTRIAEIRSKLKSEGYTVSMKIASDRQAIYQIVKKEPESQPERQIEPNLGQSEVSGKSNQLELCIK